MPMEQPNQSLSNLKCLVTGASSGIGKATCQILTKNGATVIGVGRNTTSLQTLKNNSHIIDYITADLTQPGECERVITRGVEILGGQITTLVNCAGVLQGGAAGCATLDNYDFNMTVNARVPFEMMTHVVPFLKKHKGVASIVTVSSVNGKQSFAGCVSYCMSKAAVDMMTRCASLDLAGDGIRVNAVNPGVVMTNLQKAGGMSDEAYNAFVERSIEVTHPLAKSLGRVGTPEEVGEVIAFLVSDKASFMTGECVTIDGGRQNLGAR
mmetsp:Transcript_44869/g.54326  ORF Transcript_44869/g.54326 Transcript_44869/m.54326 type:complete len:267 (+) Transcript_44869:82-882(+)|eukprot:CAMPEP_0172508448 /NCGR_PEP_ID=MMETSP1066-20121228/212035_1 /TAXON_ID=671091 /ORGANISM="Coscinodiscus wailesii, Strain CCMP2513" /LENGTH=266 /DNA_ID=CAMNT_0013286431 /DNA_START=51 /DNA_END=851 /DNA_ORIENTATION=+